MTISFRCPHCNCLCAFSDKYKGRRAKCLSCQRKFIIPDQSDIKPVKVKEEIKIIEKPKKGFYKAVFVDSLSAIFSPESRNTLAHLGILVVIMLIMFSICIVLEKAAPKPGNPAAGLIFLGIFVIFLVFLFAFCCAFGRIFEIYMIFLDDTSCGIDQLPPPTDDMEFPVWEHMFKPFLVFVFTIIGVFFPLLLGFGLFEILGFEKKPIFDFYINDPMIILQILWVLCVILIPMAYIHISMTRDFLSLRPDYLVVPVFKAFKAYLVVFVMFLGVFYFIDLLDITPEVYSGNMFNVVVKSIGLVFLQIYILWAVRSAGLFFRHYQCYFKI